MAASLPLWIKKLALVVSLLILLPALITFWQLRYQMQRYGVCFVSGGGNDDAASGMYVSNGSSSSYSRVPLVKTRGWPSIVRVSTLLATPRSSLLLHGTKMDPSMNHAEIVYSQKGKKWCIATKNAENDAVACSSSEEQDPLQPPTSGVWSGPSQSTTIEVSCPSSSTAFFPSLFSFDSSSSSSSTSSRFVLEHVRQNPNKSVEQQEQNVNRNLEFVLLHPATTLLLALNIGLAALYWNYHVNPSSVAKIYSNIVFQKELWRSLSGATAHFDALHIAFNMSSLYALGLELEESFGSIPFLLYNISLIILTTCIMMGMVYLQMKFITHDSSSSLQHTSTVGYSGVLFSCMVVSSLERMQSCPIPFMPDTCFPTQEWHGLKFNLSPIIQLGIAQVIMKRVSFVGHLAGIVAGFLLHWNLLPLEYVQPSMLLPAILLASYGQRKLIPVKKNSSTDENEHDVEMVASLSQSANPTRRSPRQVKRDREVRFHWILKWWRRVMFCMALFGIVPFGFWSSLTWSYAWVLVLFWSVVDSFGVWVHCDSLRRPHEAQRLGTLTRGFVVVNVILLITDSMSLSGWMVSRVYYQNNVACDIWCALAVMVVRMVSELVALVLCVKLLADTDEMGGGIFTNVLSKTVLFPCKTIANSVSSALAKRTLEQTTFEGRGVTLGGAAAASESQGQLSHVL